MLGPPGGTVRQRRCKEHHCRPVFVTSPITSPYFYSIVTTLEDVGKLARPGERGNNAPGSAIRRLHNAMMSPKGRCLQISFDVTVKADEGPPHATGERQALQHFDQIGDRHVVGQHFWVGVS